MYNNSLDCQTLPPSPKLGFGGTNSVISLRDYQQQAVDAIVDYFKTNDGNPLIVLPTGSGKSHVIAAFIKLVMSYPNQRVMVLTHVKELIKQNFLKLENHWANAPAGVYSAGLKKRDKHDDIIFAGIQSVYSRAYEFGRFNLILIDECHLISHSSTTMYRKFITDQKKINPKLKLVGFTATPYRTSTGDITLSDSALFDEVCYEKSMLELIDEGYLSPLTNKKTDTTIDLSKVKVVGGEFANKELQEATDQETTNKAATREIIAYGENRKSWLIFCAGVKHAHHVCEELQNQGIIANCITGDTPTKEREDIINNYKTGKIQAITNCDILTTGFDAPNTDLLALLRGTQSPSLYVQMIGRGTRLAEFKKNCLVLDFAGNISRHGPVDQVKGWKPKDKKKGEIQTKACPKCKTIVAAPTKRCPDCDHIYQTIEQLKHEATSTNASIISTEVNYEEHVVDDVFFNLHRKKSDPNALPTLRVDYRCGLNFIKEWVCVFHDGFAGNKAKSWWGKFADKDSFPICKPWADFDEEFIKIKIKLKQKYKKPKSIIVNHSNKYPRIVNYVR